MPDDDDLVSVVERSRRPIDARAQRFRLRFPRRSGAPSRTKHLTQAISSAHVSPCEVALGRSVAARAKTRLRSALGTKEQGPLLDRSRHGPYWRHVGEAGDLAEDKPPPCE